MLQVKFRCERSPAYLAQDGLISPLFSKPSQLSYALYAFWFAVVALLGLKSEYAMLHFPLELTFLFLLPSKCGGYSSSEGNQGHEKEPHHTIANYQVNRSLRADPSSTSSMGQTEVK